MINSTANTWPVLPTGRYLKCFIDNGKAITLAQITIKIDLGCKFQSTAWQYCLEPLHYQLQIIW